MKLNEFTPEELSYIATLTQMEKKRLVRYRRLVRDDGTTQRRERLANSILKKIAKDAVG